MEATASKLEIDAVVLASAGDEPQLKRILCVSTNGWIKRYRSDPASASVELPSSGPRRRCAWPK
jgi:hypothetical protein